jgi:hypothetical protein
MGSTQTRTAIHNILRILDSSGMLYFYNPPVEEIDNNKTIITWPNHFPGAEYLTESAFGTMKQYKGIVKDCSYHAMLSDGAFIRACYVFKDEELVKHSLWYWPCPFDMSSEAIVEMAPLDALDLYSAEWERCVMFRTPLRFDYDLLKRTDAHPASHLHFQCSECRMPVQRPISFSTFIKFIFQHFYPEVWNDFDIWKEMAKELAEEEISVITSSEMKQLHIGHFLSL